LYGKELSAKQIILRPVVKAPASGQPLIHLLNQASPKHS